MTSVVRSNPAIRDIEELLYAEASFLDQADLDGWIDLYTDDGTYWMPVIPNQEDPINHISLFYDDRVMMEIRRRNLRHPRAPSKDYAIRCSHIISNIRIIEQSDLKTVVGSNFHCLIFYNEKQTTYGGTYQHEIVKADEGFKILHKRVDLINCDAALNTIIIYI
mgnify:FL=1